MKSKLIVLAVVVIVLIVAAGALIGGGFKSDLVDVTSCTISEGYGDTPFGGHVDTAIIKFSIMPKETINRVIGMSLENVEITLENGQSEKWEDVSYTPENSYYVNQNYNFQFSEQFDDISPYYSIKHIKADIIFDTTDGSIVAGHLDEDVDFRQL